MKDLQDKSGLGALDFEVTVSAVSNSKKWEMKAILKMVKSRKVHDWKVCCHQWSCCKKLDQRADQLMKVL